MGLGRRIRAWLGAKGDVQGGARRSAKARRIRTLPDRRVMAESYVPALSALGGRILWVGCREYTLDDYAAHSPAEFFAVTCEAYFVNRERFAQEFPALLPLYDGFFNASAVP